MALFRLIFVDKLNSIHPVLGRRPTVKFSAVMKSKLPDNFIKERYKKDELYITVYDTYRPNYKKTPSTAKFYSKYEGHLDAEASPDILENLKRANDYGPKEKLAWPETENQWYGWCSDPIIELEKSDRRLYFPRNSSELTRHGLKLLQTKKQRK